MRQKTAGGHLESRMMGEGRIGDGSKPATRFPRRRRITVEGSARSEATSYEAVATDIGVPDEGIVVGPWRITPRVRFVFVALAGIVAFDALHEIFGVAGSGYSNLIDSYFYDAVALSAGVLMMVRGVGDPTSRGWVLLSLGSLSWVVGDVLVDLNIGTGNDVQVSDIFWLAWYPLAAGGLMVLVRSRFTDFDFARWIDGIALAIVVATPAVALSLQPAVDESRNVSLLGHIVDIAYPAGDILLLGATIGVIALTGWRPGRAWYLLTLGLSIWVVADALYSVQKVKETYVAGVYDYLWPLGLLVVAYAAWQPRVDHKTPEVYGWKAVLLPIVCQIVALVTQVWGLLATLGESERIMTIAVLTVVIVQLYVSRPRRVARVTTDPHLLPESGAPPPAGPSTA
jgi:diguanylate cyclase